VVINPLMRTAGGEAHFAFYSVMGQLVFGLASFLSPFVFSALMQQASDASAQEGVSAALLRLSPAALPWVSFYWAFSAIFVALILLTSAIDIPRVELADDERAGTRATYIKLFSDRHVRMYFLGIVAYVGTEQTLANWMSQFLDTYHQVSPIIEGAHAVALFWGLMSVGCVLGLLLLKILDSKVVLGIFSVLAMLCVGAALFGPKDAALLAFPASGFFLSVMFSVIFSLALNSVPKNHGALSGILCTGILGGAILPLLVGFLGDRLGLRMAMTLVFLTIAYIFSIGVWARPLVRNDTVDLVRLLGFSKQTASE